MATTTQQIPLIIAIAPFPEGFKGDLDETFQQAVQLMEAYIEGNFLTGLILPPNSTLPTTDQGPIAMGDTWYFWDEATSQYLPQTVSVKLAKNFAKNSVYQVQQAGASFTPAVGITNTYDMAICRVTQATVLAITADVGPTASGDNDPIPAAIKYTVGPSLLPTPAATDLMTHEHCFEGADIATLVGQALSLSFSIWANQTGTYSCYLTSAGRDVSYVVQFQIVTANTWVRIKVPGIPPFPIGQGTWNFTQGVTGLYFGVPLALGSQWQTINPHQWVNQFVAGGSSNINLCTVANNQLKITGVKLEASAAVTYLSCPTFDTDYWDAQRYYFTTFAYQTLVGGSPVLGRVPLDGRWIFSHLLAHRMCRNPVCTPSSYLTPANSGFFSDLSLNKDIAKSSMLAQSKGINDSGPAQLTATGTIGSITGLIGTLTANSATITLTTGTTATLTKGMPVAGTNVPAGATIEYVASSTVFVITIPVGATGGTGVALTFGTVHVTALADTTPYVVGMSVTGTGIPADAIIAAIPSGTAIDLSVPASPGTGVALTINQTRKADTLAAFFTFDARLS